MSAPARSRLPVSLEGAFWMILSGACFATMSALIRPAAEHVHPLVICCIRAALGCAMMLPVLIRVGRIIPPKGTRGVVVGRAVFDATAMATWFVVIPSLPLATAIAINFTSPLFATIFAIFFLGEVVRARRWAAIALGFLGVLIVKRPWASDFPPEATFVLISAAGAAAARVGARKLSQIIDAKEIVAFHFILLTPLLAIPAIPVWSWPNGEAWIYILGLSFTGTIGHYFIARAVTVAETSEVAPFDYVQLIFAAVLGYLMFAQVPPLTTWLGAGVIAASTTYIARREAQLRRQRALAAAAAAPPGLAPVPGSTTRAR